MSVETLQQLSYFLLFLFIGTMIWIVIIFILHFFVPKAMLRAYFREPYFSPTEIEIFSGFPFAYMRTAMFMRLAGWPDSGRKRGLPRDPALVPVWFRYTSKILIWFLFLVCIPMVVLGVFLAFAL